MTRTYRLYGTTVATASNIASVRIMSRGNIRAINLQATGKAGAGVDGQGVMELSKLNSTTITNNDTNANTLLHLAWAAQVSAGGFAASTACAGLQHPITEGDYLYLHWVASGTALASVQQSIDIVVEES
jgi:hypothetical protein